MIAPTQSYRIWKTQRSGSTLLYKALADTGIAGSPGEHFYQIPEIKDGTPEQQYADFKARIWAAGMTPNGVFGVNHDAHRQHYQPLFKRMLKMRGLPADTRDHEAVWADVFPNCQHIYLTRRDKVRQAVSWWRAIKDGVWHRTEGQPTGEFVEDRYDLAALKTLLQQLVLKETATQDYYAAHAITPLTVVYEDLVANYEETVVRVLTFLGLYKEGMSIPPVHYRPTSDADSERWIERLRVDLQGEDETAWVW